jgi:uncharacterized repeat protein (TIGR02543 family)
MKKSNKFISILTAIALIFALIPSVVNESSANIREGDWTYVPSVVTVLGVSHARIIQYHGTDTHVTVPATIGGQPVFEITATSGSGGSAFSRNTVIESVVISPGISRIGMDAFLGCTNLTSVTIPNTVTHIGSNTFEGCTNLTSIILPNSVTQIGWRAFTNTGLTSIVIPNSVTLLQSGAFQGASRLTSVTLSGNLQAIESDTFLGCTALTSITIPSSVRTIGTGAFRATGLTSLTIPNSVTSIGIYAFRDTSSLQEITFGSGFANITTGSIGFDRTPVVGDLFGYHDSFGYGTAMMNINVNPNNQTYSSIDGVMFNRSQTTLVLYPEGRVGGYTVPNGVTRIESLAFDACRSLTEITLPNSLISIGREAFQRTALTSLIIPDNVVTIEYGAFGMSHLTSLKLGNSVTTIDGNAFRWTNITEVVIPESVHTIGISSFNTNSSMTSLTVNNGVVGDFSFSTNESLTSVTLRNGVTRIGVSAFSACRGLTSVAIPATVTHIDNRAFNECTRLDSMTFLGATPPIFGTDVFRNTTVLRTIYVPHGTREAYQAVSALRSFNIIESDPVITTTVTTTAVTPAATPAVTSATATGVTTTPLQTTATSETSITTTATTVSEHFAVRFMTNGGIPAEMSSIMLEGRSGRLSYGALQSRVPTKEGYIFIGWFTEPTGGVRVTENSTLHDTHGKMTYIYAQWEKDTNTSATTTGTSPATTTATTTPLQTTTTSETGVTTTPLQTTTTSETGVTTTPLQTTTTEPAETTSSSTSRKLGDVNGDEVINIIDALEILKFLAGLQSVIDTDPQAIIAARITVEYPANPTIQCVLEILKYLAGLPNKVGS